MKKVICIAVDLINADKPPASLAFLAGACEKATVDYQCISLNGKFLSLLSKANMDKVYNSLLKTGSTEDIVSILKDPLDDIIKDVKEYSPDLILVSIFSFMQKTLAEVFLKFIRLNLPTVEIIAGGPGVSSTDELHRTFGSVLLKNNLVDYYCLGEGDVVLPEFLNGKKDSLGINGKDTGPESWVPQLDDLDNQFLLPSYKKIEVGNYHNLELKNSAIFSISTSRGCVRDCAFCDVSNTWKKFRFRSGQHVADEILKHHLDVGAVHFTIVDSLINGSLKSFKEFNLAMIKLKETYPGLEKFSYNGMFIVRDKKTHNEEMFRLMQAAGCESLAIGVETGSDRLRFEMNKKFTNEDLDFHLEMCSKYNIRNSLLMFVGYPTETEEDFEQSLKMLGRYQKYLIDDTVIGINHSGVFNLVPGSPLYKSKDEIGIEIGHHYNSSVLKWINKNNPSLTQKERALRDLEFRRRALELRYPIPYANRYVQYLKQVSSDFVLASD